MTSEERYFTIKEAAKLLGVSTLTIKRRIKNGGLITEGRMGRRGLERVIPQRALNIEIMSFLPAAHLLTLSDFEAIVLKRFEATVPRSDRRASNALKQLRREHEQLKAELNGFKASSGEFTVSLPTPDAEAVSPATASSPQRALLAPRAPRLSTRTVRPLRESRELRLNASNHVSARDRVGVAAVFAKRHQTKATRAIEKERNVPPQRPKNTDTGTLRNRVSAPGLRDKSRATRTVRHPASSPRPSDDPMGCGLRTAFRIALNRL
ncbi:MAG TPA: helix-turn-helix domain-containing protein [Candidatus Bathyarchaeia archaeon]|nr:helix-turn-helix domain-containing protein [Candidatus Bathyarchaeia archaeon]